MLTKSESKNFVTSCHQVESCVLNVPIEKVWESFKTLDFSKLFPSVVKSVKFTQGNPNEVGSVFEVEYSDGSKWSNRLVELSELRRVISWELFGANYDMNFTSMLTIVRFHKVTEDNRTFVSWESDYSNDVDTNVVEDGKYKKLEYFKELRKLE